MSDAPGVPPEADELTTDPPRIDEATAAKVGADRFGVEGEVKALASERDKNFRIRTAGGDAYVLKFANPAEDAGILDLQAQALQHVAAVDPDLPVPRVRPTVDGALHDEVLSSEDGRRSLVRMLTYVEGVTPDPVDLDERGLRSFGRTTGRMGRALRGFYHPSAGRALLWDLRRAGELIPLTEHARDAERGAMARRLLERYRDEVVPRLSLARGQIIHNDMYLANLLVDPDDVQTISGIIDFGDMLFTVLLEDLAVLVADLMLDRDDPFASAMLGTAGYEEVLPLDPLERELLPEVVIARMLATSVIAEWRIGLDPTNEYLWVGVEESWRFVEKLVEVGIEGGEVHRRMATGDDHGLDSTTAPPQGGRAEETDSLLERRRRVMSPVSPLSYDEPVHLVRGEGVWMFDPAGNAYLDVYNNVPVSGHANPRLAEVMARQARTLITNTRYLHGTVVEASERLIATMPADSGLDTVLWVNSGSEANETAMRLASAAAGDGRRGAIVTEFAYHGVTLLGSDISSEEWPPGVRPRGIGTIPSPDGYRGRYRADDDPAWAAHYAAHTDKAIATIRGDGEQPALYYQDGGFVSDGMLEVPPAYVQDVVGRVRAAGGYYVADEVQAGFGRVGTSLWSFEGYEVAPDFVTLGKPMGNGFPVAALVTRRDLVEPFGRKIPELFSTFGGNTLAATVALENLTIVQEWKLRENAAEVGAYLKEQLIGLAATHPAIGQVRGSGLMIGVELVTDPATREPDEPLASRVANGMRNRRILIGTTGRGENVLKLRPPLVFTREHADLLVATLDETLSDLRA